MADIIPLDAATRRLTRPSETVAPTSGPAQLLFFTGVRYERQVAETQKKPRKRKVISVHTDAAIGS